jgi:hypothetical protein
VEYTQNNVIPATTSFLQQGHSPSHRHYREGGNPGRVTVHGDTASGNGKEPGG